VALRERSVKYAIRIPAKDRLERDIPGMGRSLASVETGSIQGKRSVRWVARAAAALEANIQCCLSLIRESNFRNLLRNSSL
jgi:hypothetical protein